MHDAEGSEDAIPSGNIPSLRTQRMRQLRDAGGFECVTIEVENILTLVGRKLRATNRSTCCVLVRERDSVQAPVIR